MKRKAKYRIVTIQREMLYVGDEVDHTLTLTAMEGEAIEYQKGVAGEFVSRRSVGFHDRIKGSGPMQGYAVTTFEEGQVYSRYEGQRDAKNKTTTGTWKTYKGVGKLKNIKGQGTFKVSSGTKPDEYILEIDGDYEL
ncbi:hypothetical protein [Desulfobacca acetoxidans]